ncbi:MAG: hypothetical protein IPM42_13425 [Saprospiraceae bacterium]|nr:hypothetical protein [Saprospiraceae bacterium]
MAWYVDESAKTLWNLNGKVGDPYDYYGLIWQGLGNGAGVNPETSMAFNIYITEIMNEEGNNPESYERNQWIISHYQRYSEKIKPFNKLKFDCL